MALVSTLDHFNIRTDRLDETVAFFEDVFELENRPGDRPNFSVPGAWLWAGDQPLVHLREVKTDEGAFRGPLNHVAFRTDDFDGLVERLEAHSIKHSIADGSSNGLRQVFFRDPNGVRLEVTCPS